MNAYSKFVKDTFSIVSGLLHSNEIPTSVFAFGGASYLKTNELSRNGRALSSPSLPADHALLSNNKAYIFYAVLISHSEMFGIDPTSIRMRHSQIMPEEISVRHSCYSKNLNRWMNGQKSRKTISRAEYVTLLYCWTMNWFDASPLDYIHINCYDNLKQLCTNLVRYEKTDNTNLLSLLWAASIECYESSYSSSGSSTLNP